MIAIFGTGRNGSTLLMRLLDGSPDLWVHPVEMNYLSVFSDLLKYGRVRQETVYNATTKKPLFLNGTLSTDALTQFYAFHIKTIEHDYRDILLDAPVKKSNPLESLKSIEFYSPSEFLPKFLDGIWQKYDDFGHSQKNYVLKTIETPYILEYENTFPEMRFLHIVRNPISSYSSLKRTNMVNKNWPFWQHGGDEMRMFLEKRWLPHARYLVRGEGMLDQSKHFVLRYEDLIINSGATILEIFNWLGATPPSDPTNLTVLGGKIPNKPSNLSAIGVKTPAKVVQDMATRFGYYDVLPTREKKFILFRTHNIAGKLGYFQEEPRPGLLSRLNLVTRWILPDYWERQNVFSSTSIFHKLYRIVLHIKALVRRRIYLLASLLLQFR